jgi:hypothetical protein
MSIRNALLALVRVVADEAERNAEFRAHLEQALGLESSAAEGSAGEPRRKGGRRTPALLDPIELARRGEGALRESLAPLSHEQLLDIVAQYGMDPSRLVMKWKDSGRVIDRIVEVALARATKGDAFRDS